MFRCLVLLFVTVPMLFSQQAEMARLVTEATRLRRLAPAIQDDLPFGNVKQSDWGRFTGLLRDWIESRLPRNIAALDAAHKSLEAELAGELMRAGVLEPKDPVAHAGYVSGVKLVRLAEFPEALLVDAGVTVPCGSDDSLYVYRFTNTARSRVLEASGSGAWGNYVSSTQLSPPNASGARLFYVAWHGVQCASVWNHLEYRLFRIDPRRERATVVHSDSHSMVHGEDDVHVKLISDELLVELPAEAIEGGFRRTYVLRYRIGRESVERIDPVALQPQDFVHEWLTRPWREMQSRSAPALEKWHALLHGDHVGGAYEFVQPCRDRPATVRIAVDLYRIGGREAPEPRVVYFLVRDKGDYRYELADLSFVRQPGCPGKSFATYENPPSLFRKR